MPRTAHWDRTPAAPRPAGSSGEPRKEGNTAFCLSLLPAPGLGGDTGPEGIPGGAEGVPLPTGFICSLLKGAGGGTGAGDLEGSRASGFTQCWEERQKACLQRPKCRAQRNPPNPRDSSSELRAAPQGQLRGQSSDHGIHPWRWWCTSAWQPAPRQPPRGCQETGSVFLQFRGRDN